MQRSVHLYHNACPAVPGLCKQGKAVRSAHRAQAHLFASCALPSGWAATRPASRLPPPAVYLPPANIYGSVSGGCAVGLCRLLRLVSGMANYWPLLAIIARAATVGQRHGLCPAWLRRSTAGCGHQPPALWATLGWRMQCKPQSASLSPPLDDTSPPGTPCCCAL